MWSRLQVGAWATGGRREERALAADLDVVRCEAAVPFSVVLARVVAHRRQRTVMYVMQGRKGIVSYSETKSTAKVRRNH